MSRRNKLFSIATRDEYYYILFMNIFKDNQVSVTSEIDEERERERGDERERKEN